MTYQLFAGAVVVGTLAFAAAAPAAQNDTSMSFFITSTGPGKGGDLGGLAGADRHCQALAAAAGQGTKTWRAYLSAKPAGNQPAVNAKDRIGGGPWYNAKGVRVAQNVADLHSEQTGLGKANSLNEKGGVVNGRGDTPNTHDMLTGSNLDGTLYTGGTDGTCNNWTSSTTGNARVGHHDRQGGGQNPTSWNSAHDSAACSPEANAPQGNVGLFYCFASR